MFCPPRLRQGGNSRLDIGDEFCKRAPWQNSSLHSKLQDAKRHLESKREFPPYPSVASDGGGKNAPSHPGYGAKTILRGFCFTMAGAVLGGLQRKTPSLQLPHSPCDQSFPAPSDARPLTLTSNSDRRIRGCQSHLSGVVSFHVMRSFDESSGGEPLFQLTHHVAASSARRGGSAARSVRSHNVFAPFGEETGRTVTRVLRCLHCTPDKKIPRQTSSTVWG